MGRKPPHRAAVYPDCWHIPGGGVDAGESPEDAVRREVFEETDIDTSGYPISLVDDLGKGEGVRTLKNGEQILAKMQFNVFEVRIRDKNAADIHVKQKDDLENLTWFSIADLQTVKLTPPSTTLFKRLGYIQ
jgi:8-oxo-dGTP pyrophosphatase MutT (NUDIX family)